MINFEEYSIYSLINNDSNNDYIDNSSNGLHIVLFSHEFTWRHVITVMWCIYKHIFNYAFYIGKM